MKTLLQLLCIVCMPLAGFSQDISGLWKGNLHNDSTGQDLQYEIYITKEKKGYSAYSLTGFVIDGRTYPGIKKLKIEKARDGKIIMKDEERLADESPVAAPKDVRQLNVLDLTSNGNEELLSGIFVTNNTKKYRELTGLVTVKKVSPLTQSALLDFLRKQEGGELAGGK